MKFDGKHIKNIRKKDGELLKHIAQTRLITWSDAKGFYGISDKRLRHMCNDHLCQSAVKSIAGQPTRVLLLDNLGRDFCRDYHGIENFYRGNDKQLEHDIVLSRIRGALFSKDQDDMVWREQIGIDITKADDVYWLSEADQARSWDILAPDMERLGTLDGMLVVVSSGQEIRIGFEVVTDNYGKEELQEKEKVAQALGCERLVTYDAY